MLTSAFQELIWQKGRELYRDMPWRADTRPYYVMVSEIMLQQTQVARVIVKFNEFIQRFPDIQSLARADLSDVLAIWSGLGYNRRAKFLHQAAQLVSTDYDGNIPNTLIELMTLPGVGKNTAGAVLAYSFNQPVVFIETNIRTVYFHHFFADTADVSDKELAEIIGQTIDTEHPREFYWALMDYGSMLKQQGSGALDKSKHYKKQSPLKGSVREVRGIIVKRLVGGQLSLELLKKDFADDPRFDPAIAGLLKDGIVIVDAETIRLA